MSAEFVSLADLLRPAPIPSRVPEIEPPPSETPPEIAPPAVQPENHADVPALEDALRDARLFRARLADAFDAALGRLRHELAVDVLARELRLAPCDLRAIVHRIAAGAPIVRVRVAPDAQADLPDAELVRDKTLAEGDAVVELAGGAIDARLGVRLSAVLEAWR